MYNPDKWKHEFHQAFSKYGDGLYYYVLKLTRDEEKAKDIVQECFLRLWENIETIDTRSDLLPLLITYIKNLLTDDFRKARNQQQALQSLKDNDPPPDVTPDAENQLHLKDRQRQLFIVLSLLPEKRQKIFRLVREEGLSYREVAQLLGLSMPDVKKQMRLSMQALRKVMQVLFSLGTFVLLMLP